ncbi:hypothetical protein [Virgibacillus sp. CBA3643]|uniref:hypothetical protein n=1 Tax=Virgibacillus sp. CBA3643 TaxID=2942278 RepID=UPI0035A2FFE7
MIAENTGNDKIQIQASYDEISAIVHALDKYWLVNGDEEIKKMAYTIRNAKVVKK